MKKSLSIFSIILAFMLTGLAGCKPEPEHIHIWKSTYSKDQATHWIECTDCEEIASQEEHTVNPDLESDENQHWNTCAICKIHLDSVEHDFSEEWTVVKGSTDKEERFCKECNYRQVKIHIHTWNHTDYQYDSALEKNTRTCTVCGYVEKEIHKHDTTKLYKNDELNHWKVCTVCGENLNIAAHTLDNGTVTENPTCSQKGIKTFRCVECKKIMKMESIPEINHTEDEGTLTAEPDFNKKGSRIYTCSVCGNQRTEEIPALGLCETPVDAETYKPATASSKYIYFGVFPKTILSETIKDAEIEGELETVDETVYIKMGTNTYYKGSKGNWFAKFKENCYSSGNTYSDGTTVKNSSESSYRYFKVEPIKWKVLTTNYNGTGNSLLLAEEVLAASIRYQDSYSRNNNYKYSSIRAYLNGKFVTGDEVNEEYGDKGFLQTAFTTGAQTLIAETTVINDGDSTTYADGTGKKADGTVIKSGSVENGDAVYYTKYTCQNTIDKVFLLSVQEVTTEAYGFKENNDFIRYATDYAKANGIFWARYITGTKWWLRSPAYEKATAARCVYDDEVSSSGVTIDDDGYGVVPALTILLQ